MFRGGSKRPKSPKPTSKEKTKAPGSSQQDVQDRPANVEAIEELRSHHLAFVFPSFEGKFLEFLMVISIF